MVRRVVWSDQALADLKAIKDYIVRGSPSGAKNVVIAIEEAADGLVDFPFVHRTIPNSKILNGARRSFMSIG